MDSPRTASLDFEELANPHMARMARGVDIFRCQTDDNAAIASRVIVAVS